jgi:hypothetical protein
MCAVVTVIFSVCNSVRLFCKHVNGTSGSIRGEEFLYWLSNHLLLKMVSAHPIHSDMSSASGDRECYGTCLQ